MGAAPEIMKAALDENNKLGLSSSCHHAQLSVARWNVLHSARAGLTSMEHWYGLPEALFDNKTVQNYPYYYNYSNEQHRFEEAGKLWVQAAKPYSDHWNNVMNELLDLNFTLDPTFNIYEASRDLQRARRAEWHEEYTLPSLWEFYQPSRISHGSYWHYWGTEQEVAWKNNFQLWMEFRHYIHLYHHNVLYNNLYYRTKDLVHNQNHIHSIQAGYQPYQIHVIELGCLSATG